ncbi:MAG: phosphate ABC transporter ATP-binding protein [Bacteriovoracaceae bacterium]|nr:phosphate ABC transporter ATP-binding protein [Bacteriovoracaceae bacterium]
MNFAIQAFELNLWYGTFHAITDLTIDIKKHQITSLIGPSGCGKSSFLKCLNRINERGGNVTVKGKLEVFGQDIYSSDISLESLRKEVGMVFQKPNPLPISIYENVIFGYKTHMPKSTYRKGDLDEKVESALRTVRLWDQLKDRLNDNALTLQLEMQQKLCLARLLPLKPKLILLDEPCSTLDTKGTLAVEELLLELKSSYSIVIVTHSMAQARRVSEDCIFMYLGTLVESGSTKQMFTLPKNKQTMNYIEGIMG